jgi:hypothetical protein
LRVIDRRARRASDPAVLEAFISHQPPDDDSQPPRSRALIGLIVVALLVVAAVYLVHALREESQREDCLMSGRSNCAPIEIPAGGK